MYETADSQPLGAGKRFSCLFYSEQHMDIDLDAYHISTQQYYHVCRCHFSIDSAFLDGETH